LNADKIKKMQEPKPDAYYYIDPEFLDKQRCGGLEFLGEQINAFISTIKCMKGLIKSCVENNEMENFKSCLIKLRSSITELNIPSLLLIINKLISGAESNEPKENLSEKLKEFLLICELVELDLVAFKQNEGISE
jgi:hypothetical protein